METERIIGYLLDQSRKERLYVLLPGNERVYLILANLYETYGKFDTYSVYMSRKDFSEVTGLSERTITRALKELEEKKLITRNGWNIVMTWNQYKQIKELMKEIHIPMMSEYGVKEEDLDRLADLAMQEMGYICNPVQPSKEELVEILKKMYVRA